jgi:hypothetical protein
VGKIKETIGAIFFIAIVVFYVWASLEHPRDTSPENDYGILRR